jgi:phospholipid transport system substrate-binding protein
MLYFISTLLLSTSLSLSAQAGQIGEPLPPQKILHQAAATAQTGAENFIQSVAERGIGFLSDPKLSETGKRAAFRNLLRDSFDLKTIGRFALGPSWRTASAAQREEYQRLFEEMVIGVYAARFGTYNGQQLKVDGSKPVGDTDTMVTTHIKPKDGGEAVQVDWRVRFDNGRYRVVDVVVEGVSMSVTQRSDFAGVISSGGGNVDVLLQHLRKK